MLHVTDRLLEQLTHVLVVQVVDDPPAVAAAASPSTPSEISTARTPSRERLIESWISL